MGLLGVHCLHPAVLYLLLALPALFFWPRRSRSTRHSLLRALVFASLILALARPVRLGADRAEHHAFVVDLSESCRPADANALLGRIAKLAEERHADEAAESTLILVGEELGPEEPPWSEPFESVVSVSASGASVSPLSTALAAAARAIPDGSRGAVTVVGDGLATDRRWGPVVQALAARGIPVHTLALEGPGDDVRPVSLTAARPLRLGRLARIEAEVVGEASSLDLSLVGPAGEVARIEGLACPGRAHAVLEFEPEAAGALELTLRVQQKEGTNPLTVDDELRRTFAVNEPRRALYLGERLAGGAEELAALVGRGIEVVPWDGTELTAEQLATGYDLAVLDDLPAERLGAAGQEALLTAVEDAGLGLFASGGQAAFGPGGYHREPLAEILPVELLQKEEKRDPSTSLVVIIDTSGSMGGNRVQLAKEVARLAIRRLLPHDKVGIVEFYGAKRWAAPIQPASNAIELERALNRLDAGGGTVILPAIEEAFYGLKNVQTRYKHVLVLTDGGVETGAFEPLLRSMADDGINVSTVLIGPEAHSEFLVTLANWGKGRFYAVPNRFNLPEVLLKQPASAKLPAYRPGVHPLAARGGRGWWGDVELRAVPSLAGYVETRDRPGAEVLLETAEGAVPVLSTWRCGLGRVTAFTTEPTGRGTERWKDWDGYGPWLARVLERTASDQREAFRWELERRGTEAIVTAWSRRRADAGEPRARIDEEGGAALRFDERAPGVFAAQFTYDPARELRVLAESGTGSATVRTLLVSSAHEDVADELQVDPARALDLAALSRATGGRHLASFENVGSFTPVAGGGGRALALVPLWPWFLALALLLYLGDIYHRRRSHASR